MWRAKWDQSKSVYAYAAMAYTQRQRKNKGIDSFDCIVGIVVCSFYIPVKYQTRGPQIPQSIAQINFPGAAFWQQQSAFDQLCCRSQLLNVSIGSFVHFHAATGRRWPLQTMSDGGGTEENSGTMEVSAVQTVADTSVLQKHMRKLVPLLLEDGGEAPAALETALEEKSAVEQMKKFLADPQVHTILVERSTLKGNDDVTLTRRLADLNKRTNASW